MKTVKLITAICSILILGALNSGAQDSKYITTKFPVDGVCGQCKVRIENAAYLKGVKECSWDIQSEMLTVTYDPAKVELIKIHESIANVGHSTDKVPANKEAYDKLPKCCKYNDGANKH